MCFALDKSKDLNLCMELKFHVNVYLYCASKIFQTEKIKMKYFSIEKLNFTEIDFYNSEKYKKRIDEIIKKYYF